VIGDLSPERKRVVVLALVGCAVACYLALYQWRLTGAVWDPLFGARSSEAVLMSSVSRALPVPDAMLGALAYLVEASAAVFCRRGRALLVYAAVLLALAVTSVMLVLVQAVLVHAFCTLCLASAAISFVNVALARTEIGRAFAHAI
jgi:uncharacterized membrane protein